MSSRCARLAGDETAAGDREWHSEITYAMSNDDRQSIRIVLADDHAVVREGTRILLDREPDLSVVGEAANGSEAIAQVGKLRPDVAILDIAMPTRNGIQATREIKRRWPQTNILVLTAYDDEEYVYAMVDAGAAGYLLKDVPAAEVIGAVRAIHAGEPVLHPQIMRKLMNRASQPAGQASESVTSAPDISERELEVMKPGRPGPDKCGDCHGTPPEPADGPDPLAKRVYQARGEFAYRGGGPGDEPWTCGVGRRNGERPDLGPDHVTGSSGMDAVTRVLNSSRVPSRVLSIVSSPPTSSTLSSMPIIPK